MNVRPDAKELVLAVRDVLQRQLLPSLAGEQRYQVLMALNALGIAARELDAAPVERARVLDAYRDVYGVATVCRAGTDDAARLRALDARLAGDIRTGRQPATGNAGVARLLKQRTMAELRISNPRYLERAIAD